MKHINIAELLRDCPKGMELDCTIWDNVTLVHVDNEDIPFPITLSRMKDGSESYFVTTKYGQYYSDSKCVIFPKGKTTWEGFVSPCGFKEGDVVAFDTVKGVQLFIFKEYIYDRDSVQCYMMLDCDGKINFDGGDFYVERLASEEEKQKLFQAIKDNGYKWNPETKTLEKLVESEFKDGDVVVAEDDESFQLFLLKYLIRSGNDNTYDGYCYFGWDFQHNELFGKGKWGFDRLATEEEKQKLFDAIKDNGYKWNPETKTLEKLITPKFKVGDRVKHKNGTEQGVILSITDGFYDISVTNNIGTFVPIANQDKWELVPNKFDINTLVPFESRVLVRAADNQFWRPAIWGVKQEDWDFCCVLGGEMWEQCIPYEGNEHLRGVADDCDEYYKYWSIY